MVVFQQPHGLGSLYRHMMRHAIYKLKDGTVIVYNPIAPTEETLHETVQTFGREPDHIIVPTNSYEHLVMVPGWTKRFPNAVFWSLPGVELDGAQITKDLTEESLPGSGELEIAVMDASPLLQECYLLHRPTKSVFSIDSFNWITDEHIASSLGGAGIKAVGGYNRPHCSTKMLMWNRDNCRRAISRVLSWDFDKVIPTHGVCPIPNAKEAMTEAFSFLDA
eukprot:TRINITY_DN1437_c0_g1_i1.p1 TRINITY_DN1437_c0_g1~~TRINITY_DN1437_c0_g1_i1.p1  ORF type:complete len:259 (+),score=51.53 TRINITY_DN1437_c0_g1_i1:116-778(+)